MNIGIIVNPSKSHVFDAVEELISYLVENNCTVWVEKEGPLGELPESKSVNRTEMATRSDVVVVFGGDGTLLNASHVMAREDTPILGVNSGGLGFLTETTLEEMEAALNRVIDNQFE
ncbi:MAG: NAD(+)/NADH kinase, partial [bacterium]